MTKRIIAGRRQSLDSPPEREKSRWWKTVFPARSPVLLAALAAQLVPFWYGPPWARNDYQWELHNTGRADNLYSNGVYVSSEPGGGYDLRWFPADCSRVKIGMIDSDDAHRFFGEGIIFGGAGLTGIASNAVEDYHLEDFRNPAWVPNDIIACVQNGDQVINLPWGEATPDPALSNACAFAAASNVIICCAAPDTGQDVDATPDYPGSFGFWNVLCATTATRTGELCPLGIGASGTNLIGAPGRNVMSFLAPGSNLVYATATSFACAHLTGIMAELRALLPNQPARDAVSLVRSSLLPGASGIAGDLRMPVQPPRPALALAWPVIFIEDNTNYFYQVQISTDLVRWQDLTNLPPLPGGASASLQPDLPRAFYRLREE